MRSEQICEAMSHLDPKWIEEASQTIRQKHTLNRKLLLMAGLCALIAIPAFAALSGWMVHFTTDQKNTVQAQPILTGSSYTEQERKEFAAFVHDNGSSGIFHSVAELEEKTPVDLLQSEQLMMKVNSGKALQQSAIKYDIYGGTELQKDYLLTGNMKCLFFRPTGENEVPSRNALQAMLYGLTDTMGDLYYVTVKFVTKIGANAPEIQLYTFSKNGEATCGKYEIETLGITADIVSNQENRSAAAYFVMEDIAYEVYVRQPKEANVPAEDVLYTVLETFR